MILVNLAPNLPNPGKKQLSFNCFFHHPALFWDKNFSRQDFNLGVAAKTFLGDYGFFGYHRSNFWHARNFYIKESLHCEKMFTNHLKKNEFSRFFILHKMADLRSEMCWGQKHHESMYFIQKVHAQNINWRKMFKFHVVISPGSPRGNCQKLSPTTKKNWSFWWSLNYLAVNFFNLT